MKAAKNKDGAWSFMRFASRDENSHNFTQAISLGPVKLVNFEKEPYKSNPEWKVNLDQFRVKENVYQPIYGGYTEGAKAIAEELLAAYRGQKTAKDALADGERRADRAAHGLSVAPLPVFPYGAVYFRKSQPAAAGLGARLPHGGGGRHDRLPPLVPLVGDRGRAGRVRLGRLRPPARPGGRGTG